MRIRSARYPEKIELIETKDRFSTIALRKNIKTIREKDNLMDEDITLYEYDEVIVKARDRKDLAGDIEAKFDSWFKSGMRKQSLKKEIEEKQQKTNQLINEYKQIDINNDLSESASALFEGVTETYGEISNVDTVARIALEGLSEMYEMLDELLYLVEEGDK